MASTEITLFSKIKNYNFGGCETCNLSINNPSFYVIPYTSSACIEFFNSVTV